MAMTTMVPPMTSREAAVRPAVAHAAQAGPPRSRARGTAQGNAAGVWQAATLTGLAALGLGTRHATPRFRPRRRGPARRRALSLDWPPLWAAEQEESHAGRLFHGAVGPVGLQQLRLSAELLQFLFDDVAADESALMALMGFESCVDHVNLPEHHYLEGYFHTLPCRQPVVSCHPRSGASVAKPPAPRRLSAFGEALRQKNRRLLRELAQECPEGSQLQRLLRGPRVFGDLAVQIHWGHGVEDGDVQWHVDAANSALHMAVSLHGHRTLRMQVRDPFELGNKVLDEPQAPGDVYIGNPAAYEHGLKYPTTSWEQRIIALQLRLLLTADELRDPEPSLHGMAVLARRIAGSAAFQLPSLDDVRLAMASIEAAHDGDVTHKDDA